MSKILKASFINLQTTAPHNIYNKIDDNVKLSKENKSIKSILEINKKNDDLLIKKTILKQAQNEAKLIVDNAKSEAEAILNNVKKETEKMKQEAYKVSKQQGFEEGMLEAKEQIKNFEQEKAKIINQLEIEKKETIKNLEKEMIKLVVDVSQNILTKAFEINDDAIALLIKKGLSYVKNFDDLKIHVSEKAYDFVLNNKQQIINKNIDGNIKIVKSSNILEDECLIETNLGTIKCSVQDYFKEIKQSLNYIFD